MKIFQRQQLLAQNPTTIKGSKMKSFTNNQNNPKENEKNENGKKSQAVYNKQFHSH